MIILIILIIVLLLSFSYIKNLFKSDTTILDDVKLKGEESSNNGFALMLETKNADGTTSYVESNSNTWPTDMIFNSEKSGCVDVNGNKIENALSFNTSTNAITVSTNKTAYCYVYFDIKETLSTYLINNVSSSELWDSPLEDDGYRYVGTDPSNYICFGTTDKDTCINDTDKYMYRIIGVFEDENGEQHAKLIKKEALNSVYRWDSNNTISVEWNNSGLYNGLQGSFFLTNTDYSYMQDTTWTDKIATWNYTMTNTKTYENYSTNSVYGPDYYYNTGKVMYLHELNRSSKSSETCYYDDSSRTADCNVGEWKTLSTKISLMYASDYALSLGSEALSYTGYSNNSTLKTGWMHIDNSDSGTKSGYEWTMSHVGYPSKGSDNIVWIVSSAGGVCMNSVYSTYVARPVFYLTSDVEIIGGTGTLSDPFTLNLLTDSFE